MKTFLRALAKKPIHSFAIRHGIFWKFVPQIFQREFETRGKFDSVCNCLRQISEQSLHFLRRFQIALRVTREQSPSCGQRSMIANRSKNVAEFALAGGRIANAIGCQKRKFQCACDFDCRAITGFLLAMKMPLQFDIDIFAPKDLNQG